GQEREGAGAVDEEGDRVLRRIAADTVVENRDLQAAAMREASVHLRQQSDAVQTAALPGREPQRDEGVAKRLAVSAADQKRQVLQLAFMSVQISIDARQLAVGMAMPADALDLAVQLFLQLGKRGKDAVEAIDLVHDAARSRLIVPEAGRRR